MSRLREFLDRKRVTAEKVLSIYVTAGYPELDATPELVLALEKAGADFVEVGIPFSDPIADGPTIQASSYRALQNGMTVGLALNQIQQIRAQSQLPIVLMSYFNPLYRSGLQEVLAQAAAAGVDGVIIPDLLVEDYTKFGDAFTSTGVAPNFLMSPNSAPERIRRIDALTDAFLYCVSVTGVTGMRRGVSPELTAFLGRVQKLTTRPRLVGFGISSAPDAAEIARHCDGVIIGSAVIEQLSGSGVDSGFQSAQNLVHAVKNSLRGVKNGY